MPIDTSNQLPTSLKNEPLTEALFEVRFESTTPAAELLVGYLYANHNNAQLVRLPEAEIPKPIRDQDPGLKFRPTMKIDTEQFTFLIGDRVLTIASKLPYVKWPNLEKKIFSILENLQRTNAIANILRYSLKYQNLIEIPTNESALDQLSYTMSLGDYPVSGSDFNVRLVIQESLQYHILTLATVTKASDGPTIGCALVDVDSIRDLGTPSSYGDWLKRLKTELGILRQANKKLFFSTISNEALTKMEPTYE